MTPPLRFYLLTWLALLLLLALSAGSALLPLGAFNTVANFSIAAVKAGLVLMVFMRLAQRATSARLAAAAGLVWLTFLAGLGLSDFLTRG